MINETRGFIDGPAGRLAFRARGGVGPTIVWLGGFKSDMTGSKASAIAEWAATAGRSYVRFDYSGHGASDGAFEDGTIGRWIADALAVIDAKTRGRLILVGSSMGGWIAAHCALRLKGRIAGIVFIAPALDFTEELLWRELGLQDRETLVETGRLEVASGYDDEKTVFTRALVEDGRRQALLDKPIEITAPIRIIQGMGDANVPWMHATRFAEKIVAEDLVITLIKNGDHRLSKPQEIAIILDAIKSL